MLRKSEKHRADLTVLQGGFSPGQRIKVVHVVTHGSAEKVSAKRGSTGKLLHWQTQSSKWQVVLDGPDKRHIQLPSNCLCLAEEDQVINATGIAGDAGRWLGRQRIEPSEARPGTIVEVWDATVNKWVDAVVALDEVDPETKQPKRRGTTAAHLGKSNELISVVRLGDCSKLLVSISSLRRKETHQLHRRRLDASRLAREMLKKRTPIRTTDVLRVLRRWGFAPNPLRTNVMPPGQTSVFSDTIGLVSNRSGKCVESTLAIEYPDMMRFLSRWMKESGPKGYSEPFPFTSINLNFDYAARLHRDGNNAGPSLLRSLGKFEGGELGYFPDDDRSVTLDHLPRERKTIVDTRTRFQLIDGKRAHCVEQFRGERFSVVFFTCGSYARTGDKEKSALIRAGAEWPSQASLAYYSKQLPAPKGYASSTTRPKRTVALMGGAEEAPPVKKVRKMQTPCRSIVDEAHEAKGAVQDKKANLGHWYELLAYPHLGMKLKIGNKYSCASLVKRCRGDPQRLAALKRKLVDPRTFQAIK